VLCAGCD